MKTVASVSIEEYLQSRYHPDCDYVDGLVVERNVGEEDHSYLQTELATYLNVRRDLWGIRVYVEQRVQVAPTRFRVPDICVIVGPRPTEQIFTKPPFICIEIRSPEDRLPALQERAADYLRLGVPYVWILDPRTRKAWRCTAEGMLEVTELRTENPGIVITLQDLFTDNYAGRAS